MAKVTGWWVDFFEGGRLVASTSEVDNLSFHGKVLTLSFRIPASDIGPGTYDYQVRGAGYVGPRYPKGLKLGPGDTGHVEQRLEFTEILHVRQEAEEPKRLSSLVRQMIPRG